MAQGKTDYELLVGCMTRIEVLEDRFDRHLAQMAKTAESLEDKMDKNHSKVDELKNAISSLDKEIIKQDSRMFQILMKQGLFGAVGGAIMAIVMWLSKIL